MPSYSVVGAQPTCSPVACGDCRRSGATDGIYAQMNIGPALRVAVGALYSCLVAGAGNQNRRDAEWGRGPPGKEWNGHNAGN
jgi:hypothetical protein